MKIQRRTKTVGKYNCGCRGLAECNHWNFGEQVWNESEKKALTRLVKKFSTEMEKKMHKKADDGFGGWNDPDIKVTWNLKDGLKSHLEKGFDNPDNLIDIANFAMMLWNRID